MSPIHHEHHSLSALVIIINTSVMLCSPLSADDGPVFCLGVGLLLSLHFSPLPGQSHLLFALLPHFFSVLPLFSFFSIGGPLHHQSG